MSEVFEWVEIDQDFCSLNFGVAPCVATGEKCFNTIKTCKDKANYTKSTMTLRFCEPRAIMPTDNYYIPILMGVSITGGRLNPIGMGDGSGAIGVRGSISIQLKDFADDDKEVDKYRFERSYIAKERGTFFTKWRARNQYYLGRPIRHCVGTIDYNGNVTDITIRHYFLTDFTGPTSGGQVSFEGKDLLSQFTNEKAVAPFASTGVLLADITNTATTATLTPSGIGNLEYPSSGYVRIKKEVCQFTRSGDVLILTRGQYGTTADKASANDTIQLCLEYINKSPAFILEDLLVTYAKIPSIYLDLAGWNAERLSYLSRSYSALITEPTGITTLINEMCEQMFFYLLWDENNALLRMRAVRPAEGETIKEISDDFILADSSDVSDLNEQLVTRTFIYYGVLNPTEKSNEPKNYANLKIYANVTEEGADRNDSLRIKSVFCRFITKTNTAAAEDLGLKYLQRYGTTPRQIKLALSYAERLKMGEFAKVTTRLNVNEFGEPVPLNIQVLESAESRAGVTVAVRGQEFYSEVPTDPNNKPVPLTGLSLVNVNLRDAYNETYTSPPVAGDIVTFTVRSGTVIGGHCLVDNQKNVLDPSFMGKLQIDGGALSYARDDGSRYLFSAAAIEKNGLLDFLYIDFLKMPLIKRNPELITPVLGALYEDTGRVKYGNYFLHGDIQVKFPPAAITRGDWPPGVTIKLIIESGAAVIGQSGFESIYYGSTVDESGHALSNGEKIISKYKSFASDGGDAIDSSSGPLIIENYGFIGGGGKGGHPTVLVMQKYFLSDYNRYTIYNEKITRPISGGSGHGFYFKSIPTYQIDRQIYDFYIGGISYYKKINNQVLYDATKSAYSFYSDGESISIDANVNLNGQIGKFNASLKAESGVGRDGTQSLDSVNVTELSGDFGISFAENDTAYNGRLVAAGKSNIIWLNRGQTFGDEFE